MKKIDVRYEMLSAPNDGYDEEGRWLGMTPEEVERWLAELREHALLRESLYHFAPSSLPN